MAHRASIWATTGEAMSSAATCSAAAGSPSGSEYTCSCAASISWNFPKQSNSRRRRSGKIRNPCHLFQAPFVLESYHSGRMERAGCRGVPHINAGTVRSSSIFGISLLLNSLLVVYDVAASHSHMQSANGQARLVLARWQSNRREEDFREVMRYDDCKHKDSSIR